MHLFCETKPIILNQAWKYISKLCTIIHIYRYQEKACGDIRGDFLNYFPDEFYGRLFGDCLVPFSLEQTEENVTANFNQNLRALRATSTLQGSALDKIHGRNWPSPPLIVTLSRTIGPLHASDHALGPLEPPTTDLSKRIPRLKFQGSSHICRSSNCRRSKKMHHKGAMGCKAHVVPASDCLLEAVQQRQVTSVCCSVHCLHRILLRQGSACLLTPTPTPLILNNRLAPTRHQSQRPRP